MTDKQKKILTLTLRIGVSVFSLGLLYLVSRGKIVEAFSYLIHFRVWPLLLAMALNYISILFVTQRLIMILRMQQVELSFGRIYYLWVISLFFNLFLPSAVGGDIAKAYYIYKDTKKKVVSVTCVLLDRFFGLLATVLIGVIAYFFARHEIDDPRITGVFVAIVIFMMAMLLFLTSRRFSQTAKTLIIQVTPYRFKSKLSQLFEALEAFTHRRKDFLLAFVLSIVAQLAFIVMVYFLALSIHIDLPISLFLLFMPIVTVISLIPSIGGLGVREAATVYLFRHHMDLHQAVALSLIFDVFLYGIGALCGILYAIKGGATLTEMEKIEEEALENGENG